MEKIHTIFTETLENGKEGKLGIDDNANLYWNEKQVVTKQKLTLGWWLNLSIILASFSTILIALCTLYQCFC